LSVAKAAIFEEPAGTVKKINSIYLAEYGIEIDVNGKFLGREFNIRFWAEW